MICFYQKPFKNQENSQHGSAIVWVFVVIALFGMLTFMMSKGSRTGTQNIDREKSQLIANEIMNFGRTVKDTTQKLRISGCEDTEISFQTTETGTDQQNNNAPSDNSCHVFHTDGGALRLAKVPDAIMTTSHVFPRFVGSDIILNVGTGAPELSMWMRTVSKNVCTAYNSLLGVPNVGDDAPVENGFEATYFKGSYTSDETIGDDNGGANFNGKAAGCLRHASETDANGQPYYDFYYVLVAR